MRFAIQWTLLLLAALLIEFVWEAALGRWLAPPCLTLVVGLAAAMRMGPVRGAWIAGVAGLASDLARLRPDGVEALAAIAIGALAGLAGRRIVMDLAVVRWFFAALFIVTAGLISGLLDAMLYADFAFNAAGALLAIAAWPVIIRVSPTPAPPTVEIERRT